MFWAIALGISTGMRTMTGIAVVCWAAWLGYLPLQGTWAFWTANLAVPIVFTLFALGEYIGDTLPRTPSRTAWPLVLGRLSFAVLVGLVVATALGQPKAGGFVLGCMGALIGIYGGYRVRMTGARLVGKDLPVALIESAFALGLALAALHHIHHEIVTFGKTALLPA